VTGVQTCALPIYLGPTRGELIEKTALAVEQSRAPQEARREAAAALRDLLGVAGATTGPDPIQAISDDLIGACLSTLDPKTREELEDEARRGLGRHAQDMSPDVRERALRLALERIVRHRFGLPNLTLLPPF
jgi:hypothetical protein